MADNTSEPKLTIFADLLRAQLKELGISQRELAIRLGMTPQALGNYTNSRTQPGYEVLLQIARALEISPQALVPNTIDHI
jgi:transcriptional regulator with XRE-family HTH domain